MFVIRLSFMPLFCFKLLYLVLLGRPCDCVCIASFIWKQLCVFALVADLDRYSE